MKAVVFLRETNIEMDIDLAAGDDEVCIDECVCF